MNLSIIIPAFNEEKSIQILIEEIQSVLSSSTFIYEIIVIDDGSTDSTWTILTDLHNSVKRYDNFDIRAINFKRNLGK